MIIPELRSAQLKSFTIPNIICSSNLRLLASISVPFNLLVGVGRESLPYFRLSHESFLLRQTPETIFIKQLLTPALPRVKNSLVLSPLHTYSTRVPPNLTFVIDDMEEPWTFPKKFDFIHSRMMVGSFVSWEAFLDKAMRYSICFNFTTGRR
jgi:hypothetical protein